MEDLSCFTALRVCGSSTLKYLDVQVLARLSPKSLAFGSNLQAFPNNRPNGDQNSFGISIRRVKLPNIKVSMSTECVSAFGDPQTKKKVHTFFIGKKTQNPVPFARICSFCTKLIWSKPNQPPLALLSSGFPSGSSHPSTPLHSLDPPHGSASGKQTLSGRLWFSCFVFALRNQKN